MTDHDLDTLMQRVLLDSLRLDWEKRAEPEPAFVPSARYKRQAAGMLADPLAWERKRAVPVWKNIARRTAAVLLIVSIGFGSLLAVSPAVRAAVNQWVIEWYETHITYRYTGEDMAGPNGYCLPERRNRENNLSELYADGSRHRYGLYYGRVRNIGSHGKRAGRSAFLGGRLGEPSERGHLDRPGPRTTVHGGSES